MGNTYNIGMQKCFRGARGFRKLAPVWLMLFLLGAPAGDPVAIAGNPPAKSPPAKPLPTPKIRESLKDFCNLVTHCRLPLPPGYCPDSILLGKPKVTYDSARCLEARVLNDRGVGPSHPVVGFRLYRFLGMEYRVIYTVEDNIPISEARLAYLLADLPLSARLVSLYQKEPYTAVYVDSERKYFKGTKGKNLRGEARLISGSAQERRLFYFGEGVAEVAWWTLKGPALMDFTYSPSDKKLHYRMKILVFPGNGIINKIMNLGLFKKIVYGKIKEVLKDITETANKLAADNGSAVLNSKTPATPGSAGPGDWSAEEKRKIVEFLRLP